MSSLELDKFQRFWEDGEDGWAYYSKVLAVRYWPALDPIKYQLASALGNLEISIDAGIVLLLPRDCLELSFINNFHLSIFPVVAYCHIMWSYN